MELQMYTVLLRARGAGCWKVGGGAGDEESINVMDRSRKAG